MRRGKSRKGVGSGEQGMGSRELRLENKECCWFFYSLFPIPYSLAVAVLTYGGKLRLLSFRSTHREIFLLSLTWTRTMTPVPRRLEPVR